MSVTPGPWCAIPYEPPEEPWEFKLYSEGTWLVVGPNDHTIAACSPCDDGTHPDDSPEDNAKWIAACVNSTADRLGSWPTGTDT